MHAHALVREVSTRCRAGCADVRPVVVLHFDDLAVASSPSTIIHSSHAPPTHLLHRKASGSKDTSTGPWTTSCKAPAQASTSSQASERFLQKKCSTAKGKVVAAARAARTTCKVSSGCSRAKAKAMAAWTAAALHPAANGGAFNSPRPGSPKMASSPSPPPSPPAAAPPRAVAPVASPPGRAPRKPTPRTPAFQGPKRASIPNQKSVR